MSYGLALFFVPLAAWSRDATVVILTLTVVAITHSQWSSRAVLWRSVFSLSAAKFLSLMMLFAGLSLVWSPQFSPLPWAQASLTIFLCMMLCAGMQRFQVEGIWKAIKPTVMAGGALLAVLLAERLTGGFFVGLHRTEQTAEQLFNVMNGGLVLMACMSIPAMCLLRLKTSSWTWPVILFCLCFALGLSYRMDAVPVAMLAALLSFLLVQKWGVRMAVAIMVLIGIVSVGWALLAAIWATPTLQVWFTDNIHPNWGHRIAIWGRASEFIHQSILFGHGFDAARTLGQTAGLIPDPAGRTSFLHPHNGMIHLWLELGGVGVAVFIAALIASVRSVLSKRSNRCIAALVTGTFSATATIWLLSFGVWQPWWIAVLGLTTAAVMGVVKLAAADTPRQSVNL
ncbi:MAG: O-antigen ligase family protein [Rhodospirillaceae bacterium]